MLRRSEVVACSLVVLLEAVVASLIADHWLIDRLQDLSMRRLKAPRSSSQVGLGLHQMKSPRWSLVREIVLTALPVKP